jgi:signal transduction histidine kinase
MLGYTEDELLSMSILDFHPPHDAATLARIEARYDGNIREDKDVPMRRKDGSVFYADVMGNRLAFDGRPCVLGLFRDITERKQAQAALERERQTLKHLLQSSEHERQLIAYEIHDGLAQYLAGSLMQFEVYKHFKDTKPEEAARAYEAGMTMLRQGHADARRLIGGVRPPILDEEGVVAAVTHLVSEQRREKGPKIEFRNEVEFDRLVPILENAIYRVVQEGLGNACRHSQSQQVRVELVQHGDHLRIAVRDWGVGFEPGAVEADRFGLAGMRERARLLGGSMRIESAPGQGTSIVVELPLAARE